MCCKTENVAEELSDSSATFAVLMVITSLMAYVVNKMTISLATLCKNGS